MFSFAEFGNDLYTGRRSYEFVARRKLWYSLGAIMIAISIVGLLTVGLNPGIEFRGGSEFRVTNVDDTGTVRAQNVVTDIVPGAGEVRVSSVNDDGLRIQTEKLTEAQTTQIADALATEYGL